MIKWFQRSVITYFKNNCAKRNAFLIFRSPSPVPVRHGKRKRRSLFQGIEILKISDPATNKVYLQCSICKYPVLLSNPLNSDVSPHQIMTQHITDKHLGESRKNFIFLKVYLKDKFLKVFLNNSLAQVNEEELLCRWLPPLEKRRKQGERSLRARFVS